MPARIETIRKPPAKAERSGLEGSRASRRQAADAERAQAAVPEAEAERRRARSRSSSRRPRYEAASYKPAGKLEGKCALITGGDSGIGRAVAVLYAREGADVAISYLPEEQTDAEETLRAVEAEGRRCVLHPGDLGEAKFCKDARRADRERARQARHPRLERRAPEPQEVARRARPTKSSRPRST